MLPRTEKPCVDGLEMSLGLPELARRDAAQAQAKDAGFHKDFCSANQFASLGQCRLQYRHGAQNHRHLAFAALLSEDLSPSLHCGEGAGFVSGHQRRCSSWELYSAFFCLRGSGVLHGISQRVSWRPHY